MMGQPTEGALIALAMKVGDVLLPFHTFTWSQGSAVSPPCCPVPGAERLLTRVEGIGGGLMGVPLCFVLRGQVTEEVRSDPSVEVGAHSWVPVPWSGPSGSFPDTLPLTHGHLRCSLQVHCHVHLCRRLCSSRHPELSLIALSCVHLSPCSSPARGQGTHISASAPCCRSQCRVGMRGRRITLSVHPCKGKQGALRHSFHSQRKMLSRMSVMPSGT